MSGHAEIGTAVVSYIEPHEGCAREFNRWYERDHFPSTVTAAPGAFAGGRFVATRKCKGLRPMAAQLFGYPTRGSYLGLAWVLPGCQPEWDEWVAAQMPRLVAEDRMFAGRDHIHTAIYRFVGQMREHSDGMPAEMALDRPYDGVFVVAAHGLDAWETFGPKLLQSGCDVVVVLHQERLVISVLGDDAVTDPATHTLMVGFVDGDVLGQWRKRMANWVTDPAIGFASPFLRTVPGTDTYTNEL